MAKPTLGIRADSGAHRAGGGLGAVGLRRGARQTGADRHRQLTVGARRSTP